MGDRCIAIAVHVEAIEKQLILIQAVDKRGSFNERNGLLLGSVLKGTVETAIEIEEQDPVSPRSPWIVKHFYSPIGHPPAHYGRKGN